jgi:hypothetical protein
LKCQLISLAVGDVGIFINGSWVLEESASIRVHLDNQSTGALSAPHAHRVQSSIHAQLILALCPCLQGMTVVSSSIMQQGAINIESDGGCGTWPPLPIESHRLQQCVINLNHQQSPS